MWFKIDDKLHDHRKVQVLLERGHLDAIGLWTVAGSWSGDHMSDGLVSGFVLGRWSPDWRALAQQLVDVGLWAQEDTDDGRTHFRFHDWTVYNDPKSKILADREAERMRVALMRDTDLVKAIRARDGDRCRYCGCQVRWGNQRGPSGATYDHVVPIVAGGANTINNVVIACRGCNSRKKHLTLEEAGMRKLKPGSMGAPAVDDAQSRTEYGSSAALSSAGSTPGSGRVGSGPQNVLSTGPADDETTDPGTDQTPDGDR